MSSESSGVDQLEDGTDHSVIVVEPFQWRGAKATRLLKRLDAKAMYKKSKQSIQETLPHVVGEILLELSQLFQMASGGLLLTTCDSGPDQVHN